MIAPARPEGLPNPDQPATAGADPPHILAVLDRALVTPGATVHALRLLRLSLDGDNTILTGSDQAVADLLDCPVLEAHEARLWADDFLASMHVCSTPSEQLEENHSIHGGPADAVTQLARDQLRAMDWGVLDGHQVQDIQAFVAEYGALNVLHAISCSRGSRINNPPAFVTWWCRQGHQAPEGWLPAELSRWERPNPQTPPRDAPSAADLPEVPPELPSEAPRLCTEAFEAWRAILSHIRPQLRTTSFQTWFQPLVPVGGADGDKLCLWAPSATHADWVETHYDRLLTEACRAEGLAGYRLTLQDLAAGPFQLPDIDAILAGGGDRRLVDGLPIADTPRSGRGPPWPCGATGSDSPEFPQKRLAQGGAP